MLYVCTACVCMCALKHVHRYVGAKGNFRSTLKALGATMLLLGSKTSKCTSHITALVLLTLTVYVCKVEWRSALRSITKVGHLISHV